MKRKRRDEEEGDGEDKREMREGGRREDVVGYGDIRQCSVV